MMKVAKAVMKETWEMRISKTTGTTMMTTMDSKKTGKKAKVVVLMIS